MTDEIQIIVDQFVYMEAKHSFQMNLQHLIQLYFRMNR